MRERSRFVCRECGHVANRWLGRCPACEQWNTLDEERVASAARKPAAAREPLPLSHPIAIDQVTSQVSQRWGTGSGELDRVLGGGVVPGSLVLVGGEPGIGKSTLLLQAAHGLTKAVDTVLYVSGEESLQQTRLRAERLGALGPGLLVLAETNLDRIGEVVREVAPPVMILDSIQTTYLPALTSAPGSVSQVRESAYEIMQWAKGRGMAVFLVGHINKSGALAGPKVLEHTVDTVLTFEGDRHSPYRLLRAAKNRFGGTDEIGLFQMDAEGLAEVPNPSAYFLAERAHGRAGSVVCACLEGTRPLLLEVQALMAGAAYGTPRRTATGVDANRLSLLLAVLEKRVGLQVGMLDAYVKVTGGVRIDEPAVDLALAVALASSFRNRAVDPQTVVLGEVGLGGEVRSVQRVGERVREAARLGFARCVVPAASMRGLKQPEGMVCLPVRNVEEALDATLVG